MSKVHQHPGDTQVLKRRFKNLDTDKVVELPDYMPPSVIHGIPAKDERRRQRVTEEIELLCKQYFGFRPRPFHVQALSRMLQGGKFIINWPTDHGKSLVGCWLFPILSLMQDPNATHIICCATQDDSKRWLSMIKQALEPDGVLGDNVSNEFLLRDYPWIARPEKGLWTNTEINIAGRSRANPNPSVLATTWNASDIKGRRGKLIMDDLEGMKQRDSPREREKLFDWIQYEAIRNWEDAHESDRPLQVMLGTPFYLDSIYFALESAGWEVDRMAYKRWTCKCENCQGDENLAFENDHGELVWPAKRAKIDELRQRYSKSAFAIAMKMDPKGDDRSQLSYKEIAQLAAAANAEPVNQTVDCPHCRGSGYMMVSRGGVYGRDRCPYCQGDRRVVEPTTLVCLDPASGSKSRQADYAGISVNRYIWQIGDPLPRIETFQAFQFTEGLHEQCRLCASLAEKYNCQVLFETNAQQGGNYRETFQDFHPDIQVQGMHNMASKKLDRQLGLTSLRSMLKEKRIFVPESRHDDPGIQRLFREIRDLGIDRHDHIVMSVWLGMRWTYENARIELLNKVAEQQAQAQRNRPQRAFGYTNDWRSQFGWDGRH